MAKKLLLHAPYISCQTLADKSRIAGQLYSVPEVGDVVLFYNGSRYNHTGVVLTVNKATKTFTTAEGNTSGANGVIPNGGGVVIGKTYTYGGTVRFHRPNWSLLDKDYNDVTTLITSHISTSQKGLLITASSLNIRTTPEGNLRNDVFYRKGDLVKASEKCFVNGSPWLKTEKGWISGKYVEGWIQETDGKWWYVTAGYTFPTNTWKAIDGKQYFFNADGYMVANDWKKEGNKWYYLGLDGAMVVSNWVQYKNVWYYFGTDGVTETDCYVKSADKNLYYWINSDGIWEPKWNTETPDKKKYRVIG